MVDNSKNPLLTVVHKAADGTVFYGFLDPLTIPASRGIAAEKAKRFVDMKITDRSLREMIRQIKIEAGAGDIVKAFAIVQEIEYRLEFLSEESSLLDLACVYFMLDGEDILNPTDAFSRKKHAIFAKDASTKGFFLLLALSIVTKYSEKQEGDLLNYLEDSKSMSERIRRYIQEESLITSISGSTNSSTMPVKEG